MPTPRQDPDPAPPVPPTPQPVPKPIREPDPIRLPDEDPVPNPDENDYPPQHAGGPEFAAVETLSKREAEEFLRRSSLTYLECCISLMLTHLSIEETAGVLERQAAILREWG